MTSPDPNLSDSLRLEIDELDDQPFSSFRTLFEGFDLPTTNMDFNHSEASYEVQNIDVKDAESGWCTDDIDEIMLLSKRQTFLPTIEEIPEVTPRLPATTSLSDFTFEPSQEMHHRFVSTKVCIHRETGRKYTIKCKRLCNTFSWAERDILEMFAEMPGSFFPQLRSSFQYKEYMYILTDHYPNRLLDLVSKYGTFASHHALFYAAEILAAISDLHDLGIVHRNLRPENIVVDEFGHVLLTSFEEACAIKGKTLNAPCSERNIDEHLAPEVLLGWAHDGAVDCWGFGILLYFMFFGSCPVSLRDRLGDPLSLKRHIVDCPISSESLRLIHPMARDLIMKCLERNPAIRLNVEGIKRHPYFSQTDWESVHCRVNEAPYFVPLTPETAVKTEQQQEASSPGYESSYLDIEEGPPGGRTGHDAPVVEIELEPRSDLTSIVQPTTSLTEQDNTDQAVFDHYQKDSSTNRDNDDRVSKFWSSLDKEEKASSHSTNPYELGEKTPGNYLRAFRLRKHRSSIQQNGRSFNISTSSFHKKIWKKPRSANELRTPTDIEPIEPLPFGIHRIGSGIGFSYKSSAETPTNVSVSSFAPSTCHGMFSNGFSVANLGFSRNVLRKRQAKVETLAGSRTSSDLEGPDIDFEEVGNGTFIRDMYRAPSWIISPPSRLPSPMVLVNGESPTSEAEVEPLTPVTLIESIDGEQEVTITIPKDLSQEYPDGAPDLTLRLVPSSGGLRMSYLGDEQSADLFFSPH